jgi:anti-anti-sigma factor
VPSEEDADFGITEHWYETTAVLSCRGDLDILTVPRLEKALAAVENRGPSAIVIDLSEVTFLVSTAMSALVTTHDRLTPDIRFAVVASGPATSRPLTLIGITAKVNLHTDLDSALDALARDEA